LDSIYWVMSWACHRRCRHCYDDRFRPYVRDALETVVSEGEAAFEKIIANLPDDFSITDPKGRKVPGQLILAGGELLIDPLRERLLYPALAALQHRWPEAERPVIGIQTTGDVLTDAIVSELVERGVHRIAIASIDDFHIGMEGDRKFAFMAEIRAMMARHGILEMSLGGAMDPRLEGQAKTRVSRFDRRPHFLFFGAQPDLWIGELWPRGRALANGLSKADYDTNFCARWSGGQNFLNLGQPGSEVAIEPDGSLYPCCLKTAAPLGSLTEERLEDILADLASEPALQAINAGDPEAMGLDAGWSRADFEAASSITDGKGNLVKNLCIGCDRYFERVLGPVLRARREARLAGRTSVNNRRDGAVADALAGTSG
jgi:hypothetical protein